MLDVGCGWGTFALHAARTYGVQVVGVTLSEEQAAYAKKRMAAEGVADLVDIRVQDYREVTDGPYDAISSIGMAEHVGMSMLPVYAADLFALLRPEGRLLNHAISRRPGQRPDFSRTSFIDRYVFPDGELEPMGTMIDALEGAGFEVRDVESLREHYALTLRAVGGQPRARLGRGGPADLARPGPDLAALHGRFGAGVRGQPHRRQPGAGGQADVARRQRHAANPRRVRLNG